MNKNNILSFLMIITAIAPAFAAQPPVSATTATHNELEVVNETGSELSCVVAARREGHMPALPIPITSNVLTSPALVTYSFKNTLSLARHSLLLIYKIMNRLW